MNRYLVKLVFNIRINNGSEHKQFDEQIRILQANTIDAAFLKARALGENLQENFVNRENQLVEWKFIDVTELYALDNVKDGDELYSTTHETENAGSFIKYVHDKSMLIQAKNLTFL